MQTRISPRRAAPIVLAAAVVLFPAFAHAARNYGGPVKARPDGEIVELFAGLKSGEIEATFIPKDASEATILFKNNTDKPVAIKLPEAFAGVPVLAQLGPGGFPGGGPGGFPGPGGGGPAGGAGMQNVGGAFPGVGGPGIGGPGIGGPGVGMPGGFMNIGPDKVIRVKVQTVCLEHGKPDPHPRARYELRPIEAATQNAGVVELCKMLGNQEVTQHTAQAAAWHLANDISFEKLAQINRIKHLSGATEKLFSRDELKSAKSIAAESQRRAGVSPPKESSAPTKSLNRK